MCAYHGVQLTCTRVRVANLLTCIASAVENRAKGDEKGTEHAVKLMKSAHAEAALINNALEMAGGREATGIDNYGHAFVEDSTYSQEIEGENARACVL